MRLDHGSRGCRIGAVVRAAAPVLFPQPGTLSYGQSMDAALFGQYGDAELRFHRYQGVPHWYRCAHRFALFSVTFALSTIAIKARRGGSKMTTDRFDEFADDDPALSDVRDPEALSNLRRLPHGPWRSLGEHLDYTNWSERERFQQLDREIMASREQQRPQPTPRVARPRSRVHGLSANRRISWY
jgi:hypothetical protein